MVAHFLTYKKKATSQKKSIEYCRGQTENEMSFSVNEMSFSQMFLL
jgi:hypothetical protein